MNRLFVGLLSLCFLLVSGTVFADASGRLGLKIQAVVSGKSQPALIIQPAEAVATLVVKLKREDGRKQTLRAANVPANATRKLRVRQEPGSFSYEGSFKVKWKSGKTSDFRMKFSLTRAMKLKLSIKPDDVDLDTRVMSFQITNPAERAELTIYGKDRKQLLKVTQSYGGKKAGSPLSLRWRSPGADILYMDLKVYDIAGFWTGMRLTPFSISIPHDDVEFDFGKYQIRKDEEHKLQKTMKHVRAALKEHGTLLTLKLYISGYTDTVGSKAANRMLSNNRARSIAAWFRRKGLKIPIFYQGFGEDALAKQTPDETREPANRRALYILSTQHPSKSKAIPNRNWHRL